MDIKAEKKRIERLLLAANDADELGNTELADQLTSQAKKAYAKLEDDVDAENADSPVSDSDPLAKGFGKSVATLAKKIDSVCSANNCLQKLEQLCEAKGVDCDADDLFMALRKCNRVLKQLVG